MNILIIIVSLICSSIILYQDMQFRWVSLWALLGLGATGILQFWVSPITEITLWDWFANIIFVTCILLLLRAYFGLKSKQEGFTDVVLGKGDMLILYMFCFWFPFQHFLYFYIGGTGFALCSFLIYRRIKGGEIVEKGVPLAGLLIIPFDFYLLVKLCFL